MNSHTRTITLTRSKVCDILLALTSVSIDFADELHDPETTAERRAVLQSSMVKWERLHDEVMHQLKAQDCADNNID